MFMEGGNIQTQDAAIQCPIGLHILHQGALAKKGRMIMLRKTYNKTRKVWKVDFELPKSECPQGVKIRRVALAGEFNNWKHTAAPMALHDGVYSVSLELEPGHEYQYRYLINGKTWHNDWHADTYVHNPYGSDNCVIALPPSNGRRSKK
jgi:hypothetical protein